MAEIINFRPTPDVAQMIESQKSKRRQYQSLD